MLLYPCLEKSWIVERGVGSRIYRKMKSQSNIPNQGGFSSHM